MKELLFVVDGVAGSGDKVLSVIEKFKEANPETKIIKVSNSDSFFLKEKTRMDIAINVTPVFISLIDNQVVQVHQGMLCENRLAKMFTDEEIEPMGSNIEAMKPGPMYDFNTKDKVLMNVSS